VYLATKKLASLEAKQKALVLTAPFDGWILLPQEKEETAKTKQALSFPQVGHAYKTDDPILTLYNTAGFTVQFEVDELQLHDIKTGASVQIDVPTLQQAPFSGKITALSANGAFESGVSAAHYKAVATVDAAILENTDFHTGLSAKVHVENESAGMIVPIQALYEKENQTWNKLSKSKKPPQLKPL